VAGPLVQEAMAGMAEMMEGAVSIMPEGVDMMKMMDSFPIGRIGMMAGEDFSPVMIDQLLAMANAPQE
jgi:beta-glucosidase